MRLNIPRRARGGQPRSPRRRAEHGERADGAEGRSRSMSASSTGQILLPPGSRWCGDLMVPGERSGCPTVGRPCARSDVTSPAVAVVSAGDRRSTWPPAWPLDGPPMAPGWPRSWLDHGHSWLLLASRRAHVVRASNPPTWSDSGHQVAHPLQATDAEGRCRRAWGQRARGGRLAWSKRVSSLQLLSISTCERQKLPPRFAGEILLLPEAAMPVNGGCAATLAPRGYRSWATH